MSGRKPSRSFGMSRMLESLNDTVQQAKDAGTQIRTRAAPLTQRLAEHGHHTPLTRKLAEHGHHAPLVDLHIQFIGASGLPKMDVVGTADPYFVAKLDDRLTFVSNVIRNDLAPVWNESWRVRNVPSTATLSIEMHDKDEGSTRDDFIGKCSTSVSPGAKELELDGGILVLRRSRGSMWLKIDSTPSTMRQRDEFQYLFDGPVRFTRHFSPTVGLFTASSTVSETTAKKFDMRLYSTWKFHIKGVPLFFRDVHQGWNTQYPAAQKIFGTTPTSIAARRSIQAGHALLYARLADNKSGTLDTRVGSGDSDPDEPIALKDVLHAGGNPEERIKPAVYTYIISSRDDSLRFSETGAAFFVDFASKHALHANCAKQVRYSGELHPRPVGGWANFSDAIADEDVDWELVVDNNSGTYAPDKLMLPTVLECLEYNFGCALPPVGHRRFRVVVYDREDERLIESREACREYAINVRGVNKDDLQPHVGTGEVTLSQKASLSPVRQDSGASWM